VKNVGSGAGGIDLSGIGSPADGPNGGRVGSE
jgi:hypothetical protein